jgi:hypothetical protein
MVSGLYLQVKADELFEDIMVCKDFPNTVIKIERIYDTRFAVAIQRNP